MFRELNFAASSGMISSQVRGEKDPGQGGSTGKERTTAHVSVFHERCLNRCCGSRPWLQKKKKEREKHIICSGMERVGHRNTLGNMGVLDSLEKV